MSKYAFLLILSAFFSSMAFAGKDSSKDSKKTAPVLVEQCTGYCESSYGQYYQQYVFHYFYSTRDDICYLLPETEILPPIRGLYTRFNNSRGSCSAQANAIITNTCAVHYGAIAKRNGAIAVVRGTTCKIYQID